MSDEFFLSIDRVNDRLLLGDDETYREDGAARQIQFIDFELAGPNYRGYDIFKLFRTNEMAPASDDELLAPDLRARFGRQAPAYSTQLTTAGLARLAAEVDGISVNKALLMKTDGDRMRATDLVTRAHDAGLEVYTWTLRPENRFLAPPHSRGSSPAAWGGPPASS